jgi:ferredoxin
MYRVDEAICTSCGDCVEACPAGAIALVNGLAHLDQTVCADCGSCASACPQGAILMASIPVQTPTRVPTSLSPLAASTATVEAPSPALRAQVEVLAAAPRGSRLWPVVGGALVWAARELLPAVLRAWQETPGRVEGALSSGRYLNDVSGRPAGQRRSRRRYGKSGTARSH